MCTISTSDNGVYEKQRSRSWISIGLTAGASPDETGTKIRDKHMQKLQEKNVLMILVTQWRSAQGGR